ncbi:hypothetical protein D3C72_543320 [compost metagenome]
MDGRGRHPVLRQGHSLGQSRFGADQGVAHDREAVDRRVEGQLDAAREAGAGGQLDRGSQLMIGRPGADPARLGRAIQHPAIIVRRSGRHAEAVGDAAVDAEVVSSPNQQDACLARAIDPRHLGVCVQTGVAIAGQVQVARHAQALARRTGQLHAWTQVEGVLIGAQPGQTPQQRLIDDGGVDEGRAVQMDVVHQGLIDHPARRLIGAEAVNRQAVCALDRQGPARLNGDVISAQTRGVQLDPPAIDAVRRRQVERRARGQGQGSCLGPQLDMGAVGCLDGRAVAIDHQGVRAGVQHRRRGQGQVIPGRQSDRTRTRAAGVDTAVDDQVAAVRRDGHLTRLDLVADDQIAGLDDEAAALGDAAFGQALVQVLEVADHVGADVDGAVAQRGVRRLVAVAGVGLDDPVQGRRAVQRRDLQRARMVVVGAQVDLGPRG